MIVELDQTLFEDPEHLDTSLLSWLFRHGARDRFGLQARPAWRPRRTGPLATWLADQDRFVQDEATLALRAGLTWKSYAPSGRREPRVCVRPVEAPVWPESFDDEPAVFPLGDELERFLGTPLELWLENGRNDLGFLERAAPAGWGHRLEDALSRGWIESRNAGGIDELRQIVGEQIADDDRRRLRCWVLFDSDARSPRHPSHNAELTGQACRDWRIPFHMRQRRAIENYIPLPSLFDWASRQPDPSEAHAPVRAIQALSAGQRAHLHMREGLAKDFGAEPLGPPFDHPPVAQPALLRQGLGRSITDIWTADDYHVALHALTADGSDPERHDLFQSLFASL